MKDGAILRARAFITRCILEETSVLFRHLIKPLLSKPFSQLRWLDIGLVLVLRVYGPRLRLGPQTRKKRTWPISSHLDFTLGQ